MIQISSLPVGINCYNDGSVEFVRLGHFNTIVDHPETGVCAIISNEDIFIGSDTIIEYGERYICHEHPELLAWLNANLKKEEV